MNNCVFIGTWREKDVSLELLSSLLMACQTLQYLCCITSNLCCKISNLYCIFLICIVKLSISYCMI